MRLIQLNVYFSHNLHIFLLSYIRVLAHTVGTDIAVTTLWSRTPAFGTP